MAGTAALPDGVLAIYDVDAFLSADDEERLDAALTGAPADGPAEVLEGARALVRDQLGLDFPSRRDADLERALSAASDDPRALAGDAALGSR